MRDPGSLTMVELQRLVGQQAIAIESLRLYVEEMRRARVADPAPGELEVRPATVAEPNGRG